MWKKRKKERIKKKNYKVFLERVNEAVNALYYETKDLKQVEAEIKNEVNKWLNSLDDLESDSFKAGVCFGIFALSRILNSEEKEKLNYIS